MKITFAKGLIVTFLSKEKRKILSRVMNQFIILFFILSCFPPHTSFAQDLPSKESPVEIKARRITYNERDEVVIAEGEVMAVQEGIVIEADKIRLNQKNNTATATGEVVLTDEAGDTAEGELLEINLSKKTGIMSNGRLFYRARNLHITGEKIAKTGEETYRLETGKFTTCDCTPPAWGFSATDVSVTKGEYLTAKHTFFRIRDIPVLYTPYLVLSVKKGRQSGFLRPSLGFSDLKGIEIDNSFFWAIAKNKDATFYLDYLSKRGMGEGIEYRYIRKKRSRGELFFYYFEESDIERVREYRTLQDNLGHPQSAENKRWLFKFDHSEVLPYGIIFKADIDEVSDDEYFLDFGKSQKERTLRKLESNVSISKQWRELNLVTQFRFYDNLLLDNDEATIQRLPEMKFTGSSQRLPWLPVYLSFKSSYNYFYRREGLRGHRLDLHPLFSLPLNPKGLFELTPQVGLKETLYYTNEGDEWQDRDLYDLSLNFKTTFIRIFNVKKGRLDKLRHSIRPSITYSYTPEIDQNDLPSFDGEDRVTKKNKIDYSVTSFLTGRILGVEKGIFSYKDYVSFELSQSFDIDEARRDLTSPNDKKRPFSDLKGELILNLVEWVSFKGEGDYSVYNNRFSKYDLMLALNNIRGDKLDASYRYKRGTTEYLDLGINIKLLDSLDIYHKSRFSYLGNDSTTLETVYGIEFKAQCWGINLSRIERPDDRIFLATINLLGLGEVVKFSRGIPGTE